MKKIIMLAAILGCAAALTASAADGKDNWDKLCAKCHGTDGKGQTKIGQKLGARDYSDPKVQDSLTDDAAFTATREGLKSKDGVIIMKAYGDLSDDDIKALVAYLRTFKK
jgi:cytochrome c553